jgi:hypothetical protein
MVIAKPRGRPRKVNTAVRTMSETEEFALQQQGPVTTVENFTDTTQAGAARIEHVGPGRVLMWKPDENDPGLYHPRTVSESAKVVNLQNGWKAKCPACGTNHEASPYPPNDPNSCPAREMVAVRICPICGKRITDNLIREQYGGLDADAPDALMLIEDEKSVSTPTSRTRVQLDRHLWTFHPRSAEMMGRPPLPTAKQYDGAQRPI